MFLILVLTIVSYLIVVLTIAFLVLVSAVVLLLIVVFGFPFLIVVVFLILDSCVPYPCLFPYRSLDRPFPYPYPCLAWRRAKTSFRVGCVLLDFCFFCVILPSILSRITPGQRTKPRSDLA